MRRNIKGKIYDTVTSKMLLRYSNELDGDDLIIEELYRKTNGELFIYGKGGPESGFANKVNDELVPGEKIISVSYKDAIKWAESRYPGIKFTDVFYGGENPEDNEIISTHIRITKAAQLKARYKAGVLNTTISEYINSLILGDTESRKMKNS